MQEFGEYGESFAALIGDIVRSRDLPDRHGIQIRLEDVLGRLNEVHQDAFAAPLSISRGDEFQGLLRDVPRIIDIISTLEEELHPYEIRFGIGWGPLSVPLGPDPRRLDGPCFHRARHVMDRSKAGIHVQGFSDQGDSILNGLFVLYRAVRSRWTETQNQYVRETRRTDLRKEVAAHHKVSPSVVTESLQAAHFEAILAGEAAIRSAFTRFTETGESQKDSQEKPKRAGQHD